MNIPFISRALGIVLLFEAGAMLPSAGIALVNHEEDLFAFAVSILTMVIFGLALYRLRLESNQIDYKAGFIIATGSWLLVTAFGSLPFIFSNSYPTLIDAFFESMSGFTTTGASVITDIEALSKSILFWRSTTHWLGGMGIIVLTLALFPSLKIAGMKLYRAEVPGPTKSKVLPQVAHTSRILYKLYILITAAEIAALKIAGLSWFDSFIQTFGTVATGGFSNYNASIAAFNNPVIEYIIIFFMFVCGINFALYFYLLRGNFQPLWKDPETRLYSLVTIIACLLITFNLIAVMGYEAEEAFRKSAFQTVSILTTTGFATDDYTKWPALSQGAIFLLMFIGGCAGSTAGGIKNIRYLIMFKNFFREVLKLIHPKAVIPVRIGGNVIPDEIVQSVQIFFSLYFVILFITAFALAAMGMDLISSLTAVAATLGNIGPGFGIVGPVSNYAAIPPLGKFMLSFCMLLGRLEIYTVLVVISVRFWKS